MKEVDKLLAADDKCRLKEYEEAIVLYKEHLAESGVDTPGIHAKIASCYAGLNEYELGLEHCKWAIANGPGSGESHFILGALLGGMYDVPGALRESNTALGLMPRHPYASWNKAMYSLQLGLYDEAWKYYQMGVLTQARPLRNDYPSGKPQDWEGKSLHIWCEQGHGDAFMGARFLRTVRDTYKPKEIIFETYDDLLPIFFDHPSCDIVYKRPDNFYMPYPHVDYSFSLWDVPYLLTQDTRYPYDAYPYNCKTRPSDVKINAELLEGVKPYIEGLSDKFKIGVCWMGSPGHTNDCNRSSTFDEFVIPLLGIEDTTVFGLQYGDDTEIETKDSNNYINLGGELANWAITGAYLGQMDLVITADTALAHLSGVLGIPTWIICPFSNEWRWGYHPDPNDQGWHCDWYGSHVSIFRQTIRKDWNSIMPLVVSKLKTHITV